MRKLVSPLLFGFLALTACSGVDETGRTARLSVDPPEGHLDARLPEDTSSETVPSDVETLWSSLGAEPDLARCYADLFEREGIQVADELDVAKAQAEFTDEQAVAFAECGP